MRDAVIWCSCLALGLSISVEYAEYQASLVDRSAHAAVSVAWVMIYMPVSVISSIILALGLSYWTKHD